MHNLRKNMGKVYVYNDEKVSIGSLSYDIDNSLTFVP